jgi:hypothetical protein
MRTKITTAFIMLLMAVNVQAQSACTRGELQSAVDSYLAAQRSGDASIMKLATEAGFLENMEAVARDDGLWNTALPIAHSLSFLDPVRCKTFSEVIVTEGGHKYVLGTRLTVSNGMITRIDSLVTDKGDWLFNADAYLKFSKAEDWGVLAPEQRVPVQDLINAANQYLDLFADKFVEAPWGTPCERLEGGAYTNPENKPDSTCNVGVPDGVLYIVNRSYVIDEEKGVINVYCRFGNSTGMPDSHTFRLVNGKYRSIHTLSVNMNPDVPSPQATEDGRMIRPPQ